MKTLCDFFQHHSCDYELYESEEFGTIAILYYGHHTVYVQPFGRAAEDILEARGAHILHHVLYIPNLTDEEHLASSVTSALIQRVGLEPCPDVPTEILTKFRRDRRPKIVSALDDFANKQIQPTRLQMLAYGLGPLVAHVGLKSLL